MMTLILPSFRILAFVDIPGPEASNIVSSVVCTRSFQESM